MKHSKPQHSPNNPFWSDRLRDAAVGAATTYAGLVGTQVGNRIREAGYKHAVSTGDWIVDSLDRAGTNTLKWLASVGNRPPKKAIKHKSMKGGAGKVTIRDDKPGRIGRGVFWHGGRKSYKRIRKSRKFAKRVRRVIYSTIGKVHHQFFNVVAFASAQKYNPDNYNVVPMFGTIGVLNSWNADRTITEFPYLAGLKDYSLPGALQPAQLSDMGYQGVGTGANAVGQFFFGGNSSHYQGITSADHLGQKRGFYNDLFWAALNTSSNYSATSMDTGPDAKIKLLGSHIRMELTCVPMAFGVDAVGLAAVNANGFYTQGTGVNSPSPSVGAMTQPQQINHGADYILSGVDLPGGNTAGLIVELYHFQVHRRVMKGPFHAFGENEIPDTALAATGTYFTQNNTHSLMDAALTEWLDNSTQGPNVQGRKPLMWHTTAAAIQNIPPHTNPDPVAFSRALSNYGVKIVGKRKFFMPFGTSEDIEFGMKFHDGKSIPVLDMFKNTSGYTNQQQFIAPGGITNVWWLKAYPPLGQMYPGAILCRTTRDYYTKALPVANQQVPKIADIVGY